MSKDRGGQTVSHEPLVSIVVPVYNASSHLELCVLTLVNQTYSNIEVLLINDGSSDASGELCAKLQGQFTQVRAFHGINQGVAEARNRGISESRGEFLQFVDADDLIDDRMTEVLIANQQQEDADLVICGYFEIDNSSGLSRRRQVSGRAVLSKDELRDEFYDLRRAGMINSCWNKLFRLSLVSEHGLAFAHDLDYAEDALFCVEYLVLAETTVVVPDCLYHYVQYGLRSNLSAQYRPDMYEIAQRMLHSSLKLFDATNGDSSTAEREYAVDLATQVLPYYAQNMASVGMSSYVTLASRMRRDEYYVKHCGALQTSGFRARVLLALFRSSRFRTSYRLGRLVRAIRNAQFGYRRRRLGWEERGGCSP